MTTNARAAICRGHDHPFTIEAVELADLRPDEVLVRIVACGICHTDLAVRDEQLPVPLPVVLVPPMALSRLVLGVHYPSDVLTGVSVGATFAEVVSRISERYGADPR